MELCLAKILNALGWWLNFLWIAALKSNLNQYGGKNFFLFILFQSDVNESLVLVSCEGCRSCPYQSCKWLSACGLHLFEKDDNSDVTRFEQLKADIKELQSKGVLVKLSYGGEEWGNTDLLGSYQGRV